MLVALAWQAVARLQDINFKFVRIAEERDPGRSIQTGGEDRDLEACWKDNVLALVRIEQNGFGRTQRVGHHLGVRNRR